MDIILANGCPTGGADKVPSVCLGLILDPIEHRPRVFTNLAFFLTNTMFHIAVADLEGVHQSMRRAIDRSWVAQSYLGIGDDANSSGRVPNVG